MSWDPYYQGKRTIVYVSPLVAVLCVFALFIVATYPFLRDWLTHMTPAPAASLRGEWVGHLDIHGIRDPWARDMQREAVVRFKLGVTDSFLQKYGGDGEITVAGEAAQSIKLKDLSPDTVPDGQTLQKFRAGLWIQPYKESSTDLISGGFHGTFQPGTLTLVRDSDLGYEMAGSLRKGSDADYKALVQEMNPSAKHEAYAAASNDVKRFMTTSGKRMYTSDKAGVETIVLATPHNNSLKTTEQIGRTNITLGSKAGDIILKAPNSRVHIESQFFKDLG